MPSFRRTRLGPKGPGRRQTPIQFVSRKGYFGSVTISGVTYASDGVTPLGSCVVKLYRTSNDALVGQTTSDAVTGAYSIPVASGGTVTLYAVAYKAGSPDVEGTTVNTLVGA